MTSARRPSDGEIIKEETMAGDGPNLIVTEIKEEEAATMAAAGHYLIISEGKEEEAAAAHQNRSKEEEEDARKKKEEAEEALTVFLECWFRHWKEDLARKKEEEDALTLKKDKHARTKEEEEAADRASYKNCFDKCLHKLYEIIKQDKEKWEVKKDALEKMREWLMVLVTLAVSIAYSAGLNPPGGMWQDDKPGHHIAGTPVLLTNDRSRYLTFYYSNAMSFVMSLVIVALLLTRKASVQAIVFITMFDLMFLVVAYLAGTTAGLLWSIPPIVIAGAAFLYFAYWILILVFAGVLAALTWCLSMLCFLPIIAVIITADFLGKLVRGKPDPGVAVTGSQQNDDRNEQV